jgi:ketosteroid isomerase-like protein|tara:strand:+ start:138 stop:620 length:483 start_codon:yes stop_codon:yes gene_type:complete
MKFIKIFFLILFMVPLSVMAGGHKLEEQNLKVVDTFFANVLTNPEVAMELIHEDFEFEFMGICEICKRYNKETYESVWLKQVIPGVLPNGIKLNITNKIAGGDMVVLIIEGEAEGINGEYNNNYAMVMQLENKKIISFQEYMSDLLAETRLHKKKIVDIN